MQVTKRSTDGFLEICQGIAGSSRIVAAFLYGPSVCGYAHAESDLDILLIVSGLGSRLKTYKKSLGGTDAFILAVDQGMFERDVRAGWLGEITAEKLLIPFDPLVNAEYLWQQEVTMKRRVIWEVLESIALEFPELSRELSIKPEYFMYESQMQLARLFPPVAFRFINMLQSDVKDRNVESMMKGYRKALEELSKEKWITFSNGLVRISPKFVSAFKSRKIRLPIFLRAVQRAAFLHVFSALPRMMTPLGFEEEIYFKTHADIEKHEDVTLQLEDPKKYLLMSTPLGPVPLSDATTIEEFVRKTVPGNVTFRETKQIGGIFNSVYELTLKRNSHEQRIVVKKFKDWTGFKWFPLTLWSLGTKTFAVLGKSRLEREYAINQYMKNNGLNVPRVLYISLKQSLIFEEYVDGKNLTETIRNIVSAKDSMAGELELIRETGRKIAETHQIGVSLGDCKPENIIVTRDREICFVDLEQATRDGDQTWDIAEFLYYSGHYVPPLATADQIVLLAKVFLEGYIERGGDLQTVKKVASPRYTKVFSLFTQPHIMLAISTLCRKMNQK